MGMMRYCLERWRGWRWRHGAEGLLLVLVLALCWLGWREAFGGNAEMALKEVMDYSEKELSWAQFLYPEGRTDDSQVMEFSLTIDHAHRDAKGMEYEDDLQYRRYLELYDKFLRAGVGKELSEERAKEGKLGRMKGMCCLYQEGKEEDSADPLAWQIVWYLDVVKVQDNRGYPVVKKYYELTREMERLLERGEGYARDAYEAEKENRGVNLQFD